MKTKTISHGNEEHNAEKFLRRIKPGKTYPTTVCFLEPDGRKFTFNLQSYFSGMYCAVYSEGKCIFQNGDHDNKAFVLGLKRDIRNALTRGAEVVIDRIVNIGKNE